MSKVAIIGGGISGLAAAFELTSRGVPFVLFERGPRCGGVILTESVDGYIIDAGPDALLTQKPAALALCRELGIGDHLAPQQARHTFVVRDGRLQRLPEASVFGIPQRWTPFVTTGAFSLAGKLRMAAECVIRPQPPASDESIASFIGRRFGQEAVDYLAEPLLAGIHGGDPAKLSMRAAFPRFLELEAKYGSVIRGLRQGLTGSQTRGQSGGQTGGQTPFVALPGGMAALTEALMRVLPAGSIRTRAIVDDLSPSPDGYVLRLADGTRVVAPAVIVATPPRIASTLVRGIDRRLAEVCGQIPSTSAVTVALGYVRTAVRHPLHGTGFVAPRREGFTIRAASWVSSKWSGRAPADRTLLRAYVGGASDPGAIDRTDPEIIGQTIQDLRKLLHIHGDPELVRVYRWREATPQLVVGHQATMAEIERQLAAHPGLAMTASGFRGTGIADCVSDARLQAAAISAQLTAQSFARASEISDRTLSACG